jgi:hypothetical protein
VISALKPFSVFDTFGPSGAYVGLSQLLSDPTDLLHIWGHRAPTAGGHVEFSGGATLRKDDNEEGEFLVTKGYLDRDAVIEWAGVGATSVTIVELYNILAGSRWYGVFFWDDAEVWAE